MLVVTEEHRWLNCSRPLRTASLSTGKWMCLVGKVRAEWIKLLSVELCNRYNSTNINGVIKWRKMRMSKKVACKIKREMHIHFYWKHEVYTTFRKPSLDGQTISTEVLKKWGERKWIKLSWLSTDSFGGIPWRNYYTRDWSFSSRWQ
jgi:hypothetical protein